MIAAKSDPANPLLLAKRIWLLAWLLFAFASLALAEKAAEASDDFLEYLGSMENDDDNWSDFAQQKTSQDNKTDTAHQSSSAHSQQASDSASDHSTASAGSRK